MLKGKIAIVTGSTSGIGLAIATAIAAEGCNVMLNGFGEPVASLFVELTQFVRRRRWRLLAVMDLA